MANVILTQGDSYAIRRPLYTITLIDDALAPFDLTNCTVRTTFKIAPTDPLTDTTDSTAAIAATLIVNGAGVATTEDGLYMIGAATDGTIEQRLTATDTLNLAVGVSWFSDIELTDANDEVFTWVFTDTLRVENRGYTNRTSG